MDQSAIVWRIVAASSPSFHDLREIIGHEAVVKLCRDHGGRQIYIPIEASALHEGHRICASIGMEATQKLVSSWMAGIDLVVPMYRAKEWRIWELHLQGKSYGEIAAECFCHTRTVLNYIKRVRERLIARGEPIPNPRAARSGQAKTILALLSEGVSISEVVAKTGLDRHRISSICSHMRGRGIKVPDFAFVAAKEFGDLAHQVLAEKRRGLSVPEIARKLKAPLADVSRAHKALRDDGIWMPKSTRQRPRAAGAG